MLPSGNRTKVRHRTTVEGHEKKNPERKEKKVEEESTKVTFSAIRLGGGGLIVVKLVCNLFLTGCYYLEG